MGSACCCFRPEDIEDLAYINGSVYRHCTCLRCLVHQLLLMYTSLFHRGEIRALTSATHGTASLTATGQISDLDDNSFSDVYRPPPRPLPYDADPRYSRLQCDGLVSRREKGSRHFHDESEHFRRSGSSSGMKSMPEKWNDADGEEQSKVEHLTSSGKHLLTKLACEPYSSSEDEEDVCPTCLEEYTTEDPKIVTQCSHHFHLGCTSGWKEVTAVLSVGRKWFSTRVYDMSLVLCEDGAGNVEGLCA